MTRDAAASIAVAIDHVAYLSVDLVAHSFPKAVTGCIASSDTHGQTILTSLVRDARVSTNGNLQIGGCSGARILVLPSPALRLTLVPSSIPQSGVAFRDGATHALLTTKVAIALHVRESCLAKRD